MVHLWGFLTPFAYKGLAKERQLDWENAPKLYRSAYGNVHVIHVS